MAFERDFEIGLTGVGDREREKREVEEPPVWPEIPSHPPGIPERQPSPREAFSSQTASCEQTETGHM